MVLGQVPDLRTRQTLTARIRQALPADTYLEADYRHYFDDWQVTSNALTVGLSHHFSPQWLLYGSYRRYDQTARVLLPAAVRRHPDVLHGRLPARTVRVEQLHGEDRDHAGRQAVVAAGRHGADGAVRAVSGQQRLHRRHSFDGPSRAPEDQMRLVMRSSTLALTPAAALIVALAGCSNGVPLGPSDAATPATAASSQTPPTTTAPTPNAATANADTANTDDPALANSRGLHGSRADVRLRLHALPWNAFASRPLLDGQLCGCHGGGEGGQRVERAGHRDPGQGARCMAS